MAFVFAGLLTIISVVSALSILIEIWEGTWIDNQVRGKDEPIPVLIKIVADLFKA